MIGLRTWSWVGVGALWGTLLATLPCTPAAAQSAARPTGHSADVGDAQQVERGAYLAKASDCAGCHTATNGGAPYAGGLGLASPFGTIIATNITPDSRYGIGEYRYEDFEQALRAGIARGGKRLYPAMPYASFSKLSDEDVHALYAYFMHAVKPVSRPTAPTRVAFPFNQRWALGFWQWIFAPHTRFGSRSDRDARWNRGAYLVESAGHCGSCHTPRGAAYQEQGYDDSSPKWLTGGVNDHWFAPNLTSDPGSGLGRVSESELASFLKTGHGNGLTAFGTMVAQVEDSTQYLSDDDARAIAHYLKSLPDRNDSGTFQPSSRPLPASRNGNHVATAQAVGAKVYTSFCARCHRADGTGVADVFPALAGNPAVISEDTTSLIRLVVEGGSSPNTMDGPPRQAMPGFAGELTDAQIGEVLTWVRTSWGNDAQPVTGNDVHTLREELHK